MGCIRMFIRIGALARKIRLSRQGSVAIQMGLIAAVLIGTAALGVDIGFAIYKHRQMQSAADAAAFGAAIALATGHPANFRTEAYALAAAVGFVNGANGVVITVNQPPTSGTHTTDPTAVQVIITQPQTLSLVGALESFYGGSNPSGLFTLGVSSVALQGSAGAYCVFALDPTASQSVYLANNAAVSNPVCGVGANSSSETALILRNNAEIDGPVSVVGNWSLANNALLKGAPLKNHAAALTDPYASVPLQAPPGPCTPQPASASTVNVPNPTGEVLLCSLNYTNNVTVNLAHGAYYINHPLNLGNNVTVNGNTGVTLIINDNSAMSLGNNLTMNLTAPTSGEYAGLAFASIRTATASVTQSFSNNTTLKVTGAIYFPNQIVQFDNNSVIQATTCAQVIARMVQIQNNANLNNNCGGTGVIPIGSGASKLVE
jgi:hypothetical protein